MAQSFRNVAQSDDSWKAAGFLNFRIKRSENDEKMPKLGSIALKLSDEDHMKLVRWLEDDKDGKRIEKLRQSILLDYRPNQKASGPGLVPE